MIIVDYEGRWTAAACDWCRAEGGRRYAGLGPPNESDRSAACAEAVIGAGFVEVVVGRVLRMKCPSCTGVRSRPLAEAVQMGLGLEIAS
ncbi:MAG: hypothetical protein Q8Q14_00625 [Gemmatimonadales bacterium]|nr:hypothetical protein [Gemmatimonadales bacterium]